ncbi:hypothetical protein GGD83_003414 [Rhodoblastus sphagnicola]|nr:hypothetical protein [Rhodoblastus sphagnicola]
MSSSFRVFEVVDLFRSQDITDGADGLTKAAGAV